MRLNIGLTTVGAACAVHAVVGFIVGIALMASSGVQVLIPETGKEGLDWIADAQDAGNTFVAGAAKIAATRPTHPTHFGASFVFRIANA